VHLRRIAAAVLGAAFLAGCHDAPDRTPEGAALVPADTALFVSVDARLEGAQWEEVRDLLERFPSGDRAGELLLDALGANEIDSEDLELALGPELDLAVLYPGQTGAAPAVLLTRPDDPDALRGLLAELEAPAEAAELPDGWFALAQDRSALDGFLSAQAGETLADVSGFTEAIGELPRRHLAAAYLDGGLLAQTFAGRPGFAEPFFAPRGGIPGWAAATLTAEEDGLRVDGLVSAGGGAGRPFQPRLTERIPGDAVLYLGFRDLTTGARNLWRNLVEADPSLEDDLRLLEEELGLRLAELAPLFTREAGFYVRPGAPFPEVTLVLSVRDAETARAVLDELAAGVEGALESAVARDVEIAGTEAVQLELDPAASLFYAARDGIAAVSSAQDGLAALFEPEEEPLAESEAFRRAARSAEAPDDLLGLLYADLEEGVPLALGYLEGSIPTEVAENLLPLRSLLLYAAPEGSHISFGGFLQVE
jgi:Protein of unknown function (DUF3352)